MLVSVDEFRLYMGGIEFEDGMEQEAVNILLGVQQQLEAYLNRPVELVQVREVAQSDGKGNLYLSVTPVRKLISYGVSVGNPGIYDMQETVIDMTPDSLIGDDGRLIDKVWYKASLPTFSTRGFSVPQINTPYVIEYVAGLGGYEREQIKLAIKRVAAREYTTGHVATAGQRVGLSEETDVGDTRNLGWTTGELKQLERFRRRIVL